MSTESVNPGAAPPAALAAFLRGAERRAFLFLWLQTGDAEAAGHALAAAFRAFPGPAEQMPMAEWPVRFWKLLLALPTTRSPEQAGHDRPPALAFLEDLPAAARRALLLRQVAGLDEATAASILGLDPGAYEQALARACPRDSGGAPDAAGWRRQAEAIQQAGRELDEARLQRLAQLRQDALAGRSVPPAPAAAPRRPTPAPEARSRRLMPMGARRGVVALVLIVALAATGVAWWRTQGATGSLQATSSAADEGSGDLRVVDNPPVVVEPLPEPDPPAQAQAPDWPALLPEPVLEPAVAELALLSWHAAGGPPSRIEREDDPASLPQATSAAVTDTRLAQAAWAQLDAVDQAQVQAAAAALQAMDPAGQAAVRARFAALDAMERAGWLLGPALGRDYAALQPLVGFVDEAEREPLLTVLRGLGADQRRQLAELAARTPPAERAALRRALLATPPSQRGDWLAQRTRQ